MADSKSPVVKDGNGKYIGKLINVDAENGRYLILSPKNYLFYVSSRSGRLYSPVEIYYGGNASCSSANYVNQPGNTILAGIVYEVGFRPNVKNYYVPISAKPRKVKTYLIITSGGACKGIETAERSLFEGFKNVESVTGVQDNPYATPLTIGIQ